MSAPVIPAVPAVAPAPPSAFHAVSEHDTVVEQEPSHRPVRRRRQSEPGTTAEAAPLQMVETQAAAPSTPEVEDELPRRTKPRRRRGGAAQEEPLQMVETQATENRQDGAPTP